jgi:acyl transferase domain-containing protein
MRSVFSRTGTRKVADVDARRPPYRRSMTQVAYHHPTNREIVAELLDRIQRVAAAAETVKALSANHGASATVMADALHALERHLSLAVDEAEQARERVRP